jgi:hypothetical protein
MNLPSLSVVVLDRGADCAVGQVEGVAPRVTGAGPCLVRWVGRLGAVLWATGSGMLANEPQGDPEHDRLRSRYGTSGYDDTVGRGTGTIGF